MQGEFQSVAENGKISWKECKELLFKFKQEMDGKYRNMMWHFSHTSDCTRCKYWDNVYLTHLAKVDVNSTEVTDQEMLEAISDMEVDGTN
nr:MAG: NP1 [Hedgehog bocavirus]UMO75513.1 MAG: NP1 [Hedgehog bocavirus]